MPWSIFTQGGGQGAALTWADDLLGKIGAPLTPGNEQMVYDWEVSEGGGGKYNPLNQGPVPGDPSLTSTGPQYGGGAADYVSWSAGLTGADDYLHMPSYAGVLAGLQAGDPAGARQALIDSPWAASHYGYGSAFSSAAAPGKAAALAPAGGAAPGASGGGFDWNPLSWPGQVLSAATSPLTGTLTELAVTVPVLLAAAALGVLGLWKATAGPRHRAEDTAQNAAQAAAPLALAAAA